MSPSKITSLADKEVKEYATYKLVIIFFSLIDQVYGLVFNKVTVGSNESEWSANLADWIRHNDDALLKACAKLLSTFQEDLLPATSVDEIVDVCSLEDIPSPASFLIEVLTSVP